MDKTEAKLISEMNRLKDVFMDGDVPAVMALAMNKFGPAAAMHIPGAVNNIIALQSAVVINMATLAVLLGIDFNVLGESNNVSTKVQDFMNKLQKEEDHDEEQV